MTSTVEVTQSGIVLDDAQEVLLCASLFYFRVPEELWASRLRKVRDAGYRVVDVYFPWNFHELAPGEWSFEGRRDAGRFLQLAQEADLKVIARPGPYICSEWDGGGLPAWLTLTPGLQPRQAEESYLHAVSSWFDHILPIIGVHQHGDGGPVIALQLENELDFFDAADRHGYISALRDMAQGHGIDVPLIACAGQGDAAGATGDVDGVVPAFNFYPSDRSPDIEAEVRHYAGQLAERHLPLLVTETNRAHVTLRRLLVSGAKLLAPYLQASGYNFGYFPSSGNWGDPGSFMTHDYDFGGFLSPRGEERPEILSARVLTRLVGTLGADLAAARTEPASGACSVAGPTSSSPSRLRLAGGGTLLGVANLGDEVAEATLAAAGDVPEVSFTLAPQSCVLVTQELPLSAHGMAGTLAVVTADVIGLDHDGVVVASEYPVRVAFRSPEGVLTSILTLDAPAEGRPSDIEVHESGTSWHVRAVHPADLAGDSAIAPRASAEPESRLTQIRLAEAPAGWGTPSNHPVAPSSEAVGVFRGRVSYRTDVASERAILIHGAGDIVEVHLDDEPQPTWADFGAARVLPVEETTDLRVDVETWGHANFDDHRLPTLRMGSGRGLGQAWGITDRRDVSQGWTVHGEDGWPGEPPPVRSLGGWSSTRIGATITYRRSVTIPAGHTGALRLEGLTQPVHVDVDGRRAVVNPHDPWLHIDVGEHWVGVAAPHHPGSLTGAELYVLHALGPWEVRAQDDRSLVEASAAAGMTRTVDLPLEMRAGHEVWAEVEVPPGGWQIGFDATQVRVSAFAHDELIGRLWLDDPQRPRLSGGDPDWLWLPKVWNDGAIRLLVHATTGSRSPELRAVLLRRSQE